MKIRIRDVVSGGLKIERVIKPIDIGLDGEDFLDPENPLKITADLKRVDDFIFAKTVVIFTRENYCARCLEQLSQEVTAHYDIDIEFTPGDESIDLGAGIREEMILERLPRVLCSEDCKGICPDCGVQLNREPCKCDRITWQSVLKKKKQNRSK